MKVGRGAPMASGSCISEEGLADLWALLNEEFDDMSMTNAKTTQLTRTMTYATTTTTDQATTADHDHNKTMTNAKTTQQTMTYATTTQQTTVQATKATTTTTDQATTTNDTLLVSLTSQMLYDMLE